VLKKERKKDFKEELIVELKENMQKTTERILM
jgi:hypothetical protein